MKNSKNKKLNKTACALKKLLKCLNKTDPQTKLHGILFNKNSNLAKKNLSFILNKLIKCSDLKKKY